MHIFIMSELKSRIPLLSMIINKTHHQNELINNLENVLKINVEKEFNLINLKIIQVP